MGVPKKEADDRFLQNMKIIIIASTEWQWLTRLRLSQADLYYFMVSHWGGHAYQSTKEIGGRVFHLSDYYQALDPECKTVQMYGKNYDRRRAA